MAGKVSVCETLVRKVLPRVRPNLPQQFDVAAKSVGKSRWIGSDGKPIEVWYDPASRGGKALAEDILQNRIDDMMKWLDDAFGVHGGSGNVIVIPGNGGAYHYGCDFLSGRDWYEDDMGLHGPTTDNNGGMVVGLVMAEVSESYMGAQGKSWDCGGSGGEALSRICAEAASGGIAGAMSGGFSARSSWDGADWISRDQGSDQHYPSIGCGMLYLDWMRSLGHTLQQIIRAGSPGRTLAGNYHLVAGKPAAAAWPDFKAAVAAVDVTATNPFSIVDTPYPGTTTPPPPPPPPPPPTGLTLTLKDVPCEIGGLAAHLGMSPLSDADCTARYGMTWQQLLAMIIAILQGLMGAKQKRTPE